MSTACKNSNLIKCINIKYCVKNLKNKVLKIILQKAIFLIKIKFILSGRLYPNLAFYNKDAALFYMYYIIKLNDQIIQHNRPF